MPQDGSFLFTTIAKEYLCVVSAAAPFAAALDVVLLFCPQADNRQAITAGTAKDTIVFFMIYALKAGAIYNVHGACFVFFTMNK